MSKWHTSFVACKPNCDIFALQDLSSALPLANYFYRALPSPSGSIFHHFSTAEWLHLRPLPLELAFLALKLAFWVPMMAFGALL